MHRRLFIAGRVNSADDSISMSDASPFHPSRSLCVIKVYMVRRTSVVAASPTRSNIEIRTLIAWHPARWQLHHRLKHAHRFHSRNGIYQRTSIMALAYIRARHQSPSASELRIAVCVKVTTKP